MSAKIQVMTSNFYVIIVTSQFFCYYYVEHIKHYSCTKFHDQWSNNNKVMMGRGEGVSGWRLKKNSCQIGLSLTQ